MSIKSKEDLLNKQAEVNEQIKSYTCRVLVCSGTGCIASGAQKIYEEMSVLCERIDGVTVEMQKDVPHVGVIKTVFRLYVNILIIIWFNSHQRSKFT